MKRMMAYLFFSCLSFRDWLVQHSKDVFGACSEMFPLNQVKVCAFIKDNSSLFSLSFDQSTSFLLENIRGKTGLNKLCHFMH